MAEMNTPGASPRPEPAGEGPSWTPKEPRRPFHPKPGAFGPSKTFPLPKAEDVFDASSYTFGVDMAKPDTESYSTPPPEEPDGPKAP